MISLLWKDFKVNLPILVLGSGLMLFPYLFLGYVLANQPQMTEEGGWQEIVAVAGLISIVSLAISQLTLLLLGGNLIAGERTARTSEFLFCLPATRLTILSSKILLAAIVAAVIWGVNLLVFFISSVTISVGANGEFARVLLQIATIGFALFGLSLAASARLQSVTYSVLFGVAIVLLTVFIITTSQSTLGIPSKDTSLSPIFAWINGLQGVIGLILAFVFFLRRQEP